MMVETNSIMILDFPEYLHTVNYKGCASNKDMSFSWQNLLVTSSSWVQFQQLKVSRWLVLAEKSQSLVEQGLLQISLTTLSANLLSRNATTLNLVIRSSESLFSMSFSSSKNLISCSVSTTFMYLLVSDSIFYLNVQHLTLN